MDGMPNAPPTRTALSTSGALVGTGVALVCSVMSPCGPVAAGPGADGTGVTWIWPSENCDTGGMLTAVGWTKPAVGQGVVWPWIWPVGKPLAPSCWI